MAHELPANSNSSLSPLIDRLVASYHQCGITEHLNHCPLPSYRELVEILVDLREVLYPGFGRCQHLQSENVAFHIGSLLHSLHDRLSGQIAAALRHDCQPDELEPDAVIRRRGRQLASEFLDSLVEIREVLREDVQAAYNGDPAATGYPEIIFCYPGLGAITTHRLAHQLQQLGVPLIPRMLSEYTHSKTGIDIHPGATIGRRFFIDHGTGVVIGETTRIGDDVKIYQGVTLGALSFPRDENGKLRRGEPRHPTIEDGVVIYANATVLGGTTVIGHHSVLGSSVWITRSIAPYSRVTIESPRLKIRNGDHLPGSSAAL